MLPLLLLAALPLDLFLPTASIGADREGGLLELELRVPERARRGGPIPLEIVRRNVGARPLRIRDVPDDVTFFLEVDGIELRVQDLVRSSTFATLAPQGTATRRVDLLQVMDFSREKLRLAGPHRLRASFRANDFLSPEPVWTGSLVTAPKTLYVE